MADRLSRRLVVGFGDQGISSLSNVLFVVSVARVLSSEDFGAFAVGFAAITFVLTVSRAALGTLVSVRTRERDIGFASTEVRVIYGLSFAFVVLGMATAGAVGLLTGALAQIPVAYLLLMTAGPVVVVQDVLRFAAVSFRRAPVALVADGVWLLLVAGALALDLALDDRRLSAVEYLLVWLAGMTVALVILGGSLRARPGFRHAWPTVVRLRGDLVRLVSEGVLTSATPLVVASLTALFLSLRETAGLRGANMLLGPVAVLISAMTLVVVPELASRTRQDRRRIQRWFLTGLSGLALGWGAVLTVLPPDLGRALLGQSWPWASLIIPITTLEYVVMATGSVPTATLKADERFGAVLFTRCLYVLAAVVGVVVVIVGGGGIRAVAVALVVAAVVNSVSAWIFVRRRPPG